MQENHLWLNKYECTTDHSAGRSACLHELTLQQLSVQNGVMSVLLKL